MSENIVAVLDAPAPNPLDKIFSQIKRDETSVERAILKATKQGSILFGGTIVMFRALDKVAKMQNTNIESVANTLIKSTTKPLKSTAFLEASKSVKPLKKVINFI